jgi:hypothetical protein
MPLPFLGCSDGVSGRAVTPQGPVRPDALARSGGVLPSVAAAAQLPVRGVLSGARRSSLRRSSPQGGATKYILLIHQGDAPTPYTPEEWARLSEEEQHAVYGAYRAINETPGVTPGVQMQPPETATTVRVQDGRTLTTDGPFVAVKEALGGYFLLEADDLDAAIELASRVPAAGMGGAVEVRPLAES